MKLMNLKGYQSAVSVDVSEVPPLIGASPIGNTVRANAQFVTSAKLTYIASAPERMPTYPPAVLSEPIPRKSPNPSSANVTHNVRNTLQRPQFSRKVATHM